MTDETRAELDTLESGTPDLERQLRAARQVAEAEAEGTAEVRETTETGEDREIRELRSKGEAIRLCFRRNRTAVRPMAPRPNTIAARGIAGNRFPLEMLAPPEQREVTGVDTATMPRTWLDRLFSGTAAEAVGVSFQNVPPGQTSHPVTTKGATAAQRGKSEVADDAAWTLGCYRNETEAERGAAGFQRSRMPPVSPDSKAR